MNFRKHIITAIMPFILVTAVSATDPALSEGSRDTVSDGLSDFSKNLLFTVPEAATQQNIWADAYIGNMYPSIFPHFGVGFSLGGTYIDTKGLKKAVNGLVGDVNFIKSAVGGNSEVADKIIEGLGIGELPENFVLPTATLDVRLGGLVLPFDLGICAMMTNPAIFEIKLDDPSTIYNMNQAITFNLQGFNGFVDYITLGADLRYRFFEGSNYVPVISVGGGYYYTKGNFKIGNKSEEEVVIDGKTGTQTTEMDIGVGFETHVIFAQLQISKEIGFATLFLGGRGILSNTTTSWAWDYKTENSNSEINASAEDSSAGQHSADNRDESFESFHDGVWDMKLIQPQIYAGVGFNLWKFQFTLGACVDLRSFFDKTNYTDYIWSGYFSTHFKL